MLALMELLAWGLFFAKIFGFLPDLNWGYACFPLGVFFFRAFVVLAWRKWGWRA